MDENLMLILVVGGIILFFIALGVLKSVLSRGLDSLFSAGQKIVFKQQNEKIEQMEAVPLVVKSTASVADIVAALDAILGAKRQTPGWSMVRYEVGRSDDHITYAVGTKLLPQQLVAEVRLSNRDGATQVVVRTLNLAESKEGFHPAAGALEKLREAVAYAAAAAGDAEKIAEGRRLYGPPEPGSSRYVLAKKQQTVRYVALTFGAIALLGPSLGISIDAVFMIGLLIAASALWYLSPMISRLLTGEIEQSARVGGTSASLPTLDLAGLQARIPAKLRNPKVAIAAVVVVVGVVIVRSMLVQAHNRAEFDVVNGVGGIIQGTPNEEPAEPTAQPTAEADDTDGLVGYVKDQGGSVTIYASTTPDSNQWAPALKFMTSAEPFFEWVVPLPEGVDYTIGGRRVESGELYKYVDQQESVQIDVTSSDRRIASIHVKPAVSQDGQETLRDNPTMELTDLLGEAPGDGSAAETEGTFSGVSSSVEDGMVVFEIRNDINFQPVRWYLSDLGDCYIDGVQVSADEFLEKVVEKASTRGSVSYNRERIMRSWLFTK